MTTTSPSPRNYNQVILGCPLTQVTSLTGTVQAGVTCARRVFELLDSQEESPERDEDAVPETVHGEVTFESVSFHYHLDRPLLEQLSLAVRQGATVAIVGPTGAGKTTLVSLLMRFYDVLLTDARYELDGGVRCDDVVVV
jgi:ATP-binding cassette subfamily B protein